MGERLDVTSTRTTEPAIIEGGQPRRRVNHALGAVLFLVVGLLLLSAFALDLVFDWSGASAETVFLRATWFLLGVVNLGNAALQLHLHRAQRRALDQPDAAGQGRSPIGHPSGTDPQPHSSAADGRSA